MDIGISLRNLGGSRGRDRIAGTPWIAGHHTYFSPVGAMSTSRRSGAQGRRETAPHRQGCNPRPSANAVDHDIGAFRRHGIAPLAPGSVRFGLSANTVSARPVWAEKIGEGRRYPGVAPRQAGTSPLATDERPSGAARRGPVAQPVSHRRGADVRYTLHCANSAQFQQSPPECSKRPPKLAPPPRRVHP